MVAVSAMLSLLKTDHIICSMGFTHIIIIMRVYWRCALTAQLVEWQAAYPLGKVWFTVRFWILLCAPSCRTALGCHIQWVLMVLLPTISSWSVELITDFLSAPSSRICGALRPCPHMLMCCSFYFSPKHCIVCLLPFLCEWNVDYCHDYEHCSCQMMSRH